MKRNRSLLTLPLLAAGLMLGACDSSPTASDDARLTILLTDAPGDFLEAQVKIEQIYLQGDEGRVFLLENGTEYVDLLTLSGGKTAELVEDAVVPAGSYSELRFVVCDAYVRTKDDKVYATAGATLPAGVTADGTLHMPSACQSGFKVKLPGGSVDLENESKVLVVDFDVSQSFGRQAGASGKWVMQPVLHATDFVASGGITGTVTFQEGLTLPTACGGETFGTAEGQVPLITKFIPRAQDGETVRSGVTSASGQYSISFIAPATYTMTYASEITYENGEKLTFTATATPETVTVGSGGSATSNFVVNTVACVAAPITS